MKTILYLLVVCLFSACSTIEYFGIETYNPAEITFPKNIEKVLIVNNAVPQPGDVAVNSGHCGIYIGNGKMIHAATYGVGVIVGPVQSGMVFVRY